MLTRFLFYLILGATRVVQVSSQRDSFIALKSLKSSEQLVSLEKSQGFMDGGIDSRISQHVKCTRNTSWAGRPCPASKHTHTIP